jgi:hypothetical protein
MDELIGDIRGATTAEAAADAAHALLVLISPCGSVAREFVKQVVAQEQQTAVGCGAVPALFQALARFKDAPLAQRTIFVRALAGVAMDSAQERNEEGKQAVVDVPDAIPMLLHLLETIVGDTAILIYWVSRWQPTRRKLCADALLAPLCSAMSTATDPDAQGKCASALGSLVYNSDDAIAAVFRHACFRWLLHRIGAASPASPQFAMVLGNMLYCADADFNDDAECLRRDIVMQAIAHGALAQLSALARGGEGYVLATTTDGRHGRQRAVMALANMAEFEACQDLIRSSEVPELLTEIACMSNAPQGSQPAVPTTSYTIEKATIGAAFLMAGEDQAADRLQACHGVQLVVRRLQQVLAGDTAFGCSARELLFALQSLAKSDAMRHSIVDLGGLPSLTTVLSGPWPPATRLPAAMCVCRLAFALDIRDVIRAEHPALVAALQDLSSTASPGLQKLAEKALFLIGGLQQQAVEAAAGLDALGGAKGAGAGAAGENMHVMISYAWALQEAAVRLRDRLVAAGYLVCLALTVLTAGVVRRGLHAGQHARGHGGCD